MAGCFLNKDLTVQTTAMALRIPHRLNILSPKFCRLPLGAQGKCLVMLPPQIEKLPTIRSQKACNGYRNQPASKMLV